MSVERVIAGVSLASGASLLFNVSVAMQALEARTAPAEDGLRPSLLARLVRRPRYVAALVLGGLGWPLQAMALLLVALSAAQPCLAVGLIVLLVIGARRLREPVRRRDVASVLAIVVGVIGAAVASPGREGGAARSAWLAVALTALGVAALAPYARRQTAGRAVMVSGGLALALSGLAMKLAIDDVQASRWPAALGWAALTAGGAMVALLSQTTALQHRPAASVAAVVYGLEVAVPVLCAPLLGGQTWTQSPTTAGALLLSLAVVLVGIGALAASPPVSALLRRAADPGGCHSQDPSRR